MNADEIEDLFIRSLDETLSEVEKNQLTEALQSNASMARSLLDHKSIREILLRKSPATFGYYFAQKVVTKIQNLRVEIDKEIMFFFKKYQLAALGVLIALLAVNVIFADQLDLPSVLGIEDTSLSADDELMSFDFYENLTNN